MSVAYFIVLEDEGLGFDTFVNGKSIANKHDELFSICKANGLKTIEDFFSQDASEFLDDFDDLEMPEQAQTVSWFGAQEGIDWAITLIEKLKADTTSFEAAPVIEDLIEYIEVFKQAKKHNVKWHLEMDF